MMNSCTKKSTFFSDTGLSGLPFPIKGGINPIYSYTIKVSVNDMDLYVSVNDDYKCELVYDENRATHFTNTAAVEVMRMNRSTILMQYPGADIITICNDMTEEVYL